MHIAVCIVTRNKAMYTTTLHTIMTLNMISMIKGIHISIHFVTDQSCIQKLLKTCDRLIWFDYGVSVTQDTVEKLIEYDGNIVVPCVTGDVDWELFRKKTLENSKEPVYQRGLKFDVEMSSIPKRTDVLDYVSGQCRVFSLDSKSVLKKLRDSSSSEFKSFEQLKKLGLKIHVLRSAPVTCHYVYECIGNILDSTGVRAVQ